MNNHVPVYGLTGGIGSGKSTAAKFFRDLGIPVIDADQIARDVVAPNTLALSSIADHFGADILLPDGQLDRKALRAIVFNNAAEKSWLENLLHPLIRTATQTRLSEPTDAPYRLLESPLLLETNQHQLVEAVILVDVSRDTQLQRAMARDNSSQAQIEAIIDSQLSRERKLELANFVLDNEGSEQALLNEVTALHAQLVATGQGD